VRGSLERVLGEGKVRTHDLGGTASTTEFTKAICTAIEQGASD
jgi:isocitrate/isopropylmalate dehydrogenase